MTETVVEKTPIFMELEILCPLILSFTVVIAVAILVIAVVRRQPTNTFYDCRFTYTKSVNTKA